MDYGKLISGIAGGMGGGGDTEKTSMLADVGKALDENDQQRSAAYNNAFTNARASAESGLQQREQAAGNALAAAGPPPVSPITAMGAAPPAGMPAQVNPNVAAQAAMARQLMGPGQAPPAPSAAPQPMPGPGGAAMPPNQDQAMMAAYLRSRGM